MCISDVQLYANENENFHHQSENEKGLKQKWVELVFCSVYFNSFPI